MRDHLLGIEMVRVGFFTSGVSGHRVGGNAQSGTVTTLGDTA